MKKFEWYNTCYNFPGWDEGKCRWKKFGWFRKCADCPQDDCEDEGKCVWKNGKCLAKVKPTSPTKRTTLPTG